MVLELYKIKNIDDAIDMGVDFDRAMEVYNQNYKLDDYILDNYLISEFNIKALFKRDVDTYFYFEKLIPTIMFNDKELMITQKYNEYIQLSHSFEFTDKISLNRVLLYKPIGIMPKSLIKFEYEPLVSWFNYLELQLAEKRRILTSYNNEREKSLNELSKMGKITWHDIFERYGDVTNDNFKQDFKILDNGEYILE